MSCSSLDWTVGSGSGLQHQGASSWGWGLWKRIFSYHPDAVWDSGGAATHLMCSAWVGKWEQRKGGTRPVMVLSAAVIGAQHGLAFFDRCCEQAPRPRHEFPLWAEGCRVRGDPVLPSSGWGTLIKIAGTQGTASLNVSRDASLPSRFVSKGGLASQGLLRDTTYSWVGNGSMNLWVK